MSSLKRWWTNLVTIGPKFGYFPNASKSWLVVNAEHLEEAKKIFANSQINVTKSERNYLGAPLGNLEYCNSFTKGKVTNRIAQIEQIAYIAKSQPHASYCALVHGLQGKWSYSTRTVQYTRADLAPLECVIRTKLIPVLTDQNQPRNTIRRLPSLLCRSGGLDIRDPTIQCTEIDTSRTVTDSFIAAILQQRRCLNDVSNIQSQLMSSVKL